MKINTFEAAIINMILKEEKEYSKVNKNNLIKAYIFKKKYLLSDNNDLFLTFDSLIEINNIILNQNDNSLRLYQVKPAGYDFEYMHFSEISSKLQILMDKFNTRLISKRNFMTEFLTIHPFLDGNGRTVKLLMICQSKA